MDLVIGPKGIRQLTSQDAKVETGGGAGPTQPQAEPSSPFCCLVPWPAPSVLPLPLLRTQRPLVISSCGEGVWDNSMGQMVL